MSICDVKFEDTHLKTNPYERTCRYHRKEGQEFSAKDLLPEGCCPHLYAAVYPYMLALLYDSKLFKDKKTIVKSCQGVQNNVTVEITTKPLYNPLIKLIKIILIRALQFFKVPAEYPDKNVYITATEVKGNCPMGIKKGSRFRFNLFNREELCPASFYNLYPALLREATAKIDDKYKVSPVHCPDPYGICYDTSGPGIKCEDFFDIKLKVEGGEGACGVNYKEGDIIDAAELMPGGMCPLAFYTVYPYILTLVGGGSFEWVRKGEFVRVQCPKNDGIIMEVELKEKGDVSEGRVEVRVHDILENCPKGHSRGDKFIFEMDSEKSGMCMALISGMIPFKYDRSDEKVYTCRGPVSDGEFRTVEVK